MYEDRPDKDTPPGILEELEDYGGLSPNGKAIWRFVLAQNCRIHCFGTRNYVEEGFKHTKMMSDDPQAKGSFQPARTEFGEHWIPRYRFRGWILQRWFPASVWGTRERWESERANDGRTRLMAAYPSGGDYLMMPCGPWHSILAAGDLKGAIRCYNVQQKRNPVNWENYIASMTAYEEQERQEAADAYAEEISAQHRLGIASTLRSVSTSAQQFRNHLSEHTAGGVHLGGSEKWG